MDGILEVDKPQGFTSHDVVDFIRKKFDLKKVGHAGTLDPMATGLLVVLIGKYTKQSANFLNDDKEYSATMTIGAISDTGDAWGRLCRSLPETEKEFSREDIEKAFAGFIGPMEQTIPSYSAKKVGGRKMYELARKGIHISPEYKKITIHALKILHMDLPDISFNVICSKGTYIRQLCADIGERLGCGAYLSKLRRTRSGAFNIEKAFSIDDLRTIDKTTLGKYLKL